MSVVDLRMNELTQSGEREKSLLVIGTILLRRRWRLLGWMLAGAVLAVLPALSKPKMYTASASFIPQGADATRSALAGLAGQFGVSVPGANQSASPDFYLNLLKSRVVLWRIVYDTFTVSELGNRRVSFLELFEINPGSQAFREEKGVQMLTGMVNASIVRTAGVVQFTVSSRWPSVSLAIATALMKGVNDFNQRARRSQAMAEREFVEGRLAVGSSDLRAAENRMQSFLTTNRQFASSPELLFEQQRLQRELTLRQGVFTSLTQAYEDARIREVRDTPAITVFEPPAVPSTPAPRGRSRLAIFGLLVGGFIGALLVVTSALTARRQQGENVEADEFLNALGDVKTDLLRGARWLKLAK